MDQNQQTQPQQPHNILVIDLTSGKVHSVRMPNPQEFQALEDCEEYLIIDPLQNLVYSNDEWNAIPTGQITQDNNIVMVR